MKKSPEPTAGEIITGIEAVRNKPARGITPRIDRAWDKLSELLEDPSGDLKKIRRAAVSLTLALSGALVTHRTLRVAVVNEIYGELCGLASDAEARYGDTGDSDFVRDARKYNRLAGKL